MQHFSLKMILRKRLLVLFHYANTFLDEYLLPDVAYTFCTKDKCQILREHTHIPYVYITIVPYHVFRTQLCTSGEAMANIDQ